MEPKISYIYEYHDHQQIRQAGFLKMWSQPSKLRIEFRIRSPQIAPEDVWNFFTFSTEQEIIFLYPIGEANSQKQILEWETILDTPDSFDGFWLQSEKTPFIFIASAAERSSLTFDMTSCRILDKTVLPPQSVPEYHKIQRQDLTLLPRKEWYLANNSFLLHGYYNYHHLLVIEQENSFLLGVPGIYDPREARAAELFGFPKFSKKYVEGLELAEDEQNTHFEFGHYLRKIKKQVPPANA